jgi:hypothetical protein
VSNFIYDAAPAATPSAKTGGRQSPSVAGSTELALILGFLLTANYLTQGSWASVNPSPFWIPVLLLSVQYGTASGLAAAVATIITSWLSGWPVQARDEDYYAYFIRLWRDPILWLAAAMVLGEISKRQIQRRNKLIERLASADQQRHSIAEFCLQLQEHTKALERRIAVAQDRSIDAGFAALVALRKSANADLRQALDQVVELLFGPSEIAIYIRHDDRLVQLPPKNSAATEFDARSPIYDAIVSQRRFLSIVRDEDAKYLAGIGAMAGPIMGSGSDQVLGMLSIQRIDALTISDKTMAALQATCTELYSALRSSQ